MRNSHIKLNTDPEIKAKRVAALRTPEVQKKIRDKLNDPILKQKRLETLRATIASPEYQQKLALRKKPQKLKKTAEEVSKIRSENMKRLNADKKFTEARINALKQATASISAGVINSMEQRLITMQTPEVQAKLRKPKSLEHKKKVSIAKKSWWDKRNNLI